MLANCNECEKFIEKINWYRSELLEMSKKLQAAQALAARHLSDQNYLCAKERKEVAQECIDYVNNHANDCGCSKRIAHDIREHYGVEE